MTPFYQDETTTLYCGDCADILPQIDPCDVLVTDPPYGVDFKSNRGDHSAMALDGADDKAAVLQRLALALKAIKRGRHVYCFGPLDLSALPLCGIVPLVWDKEVTGMGDLTSPWGPAHENITFGVYEISAANRAKGYGGLSARMRKGSILRCQRGMSGQTKRHPTEKPVNLLRQLIESSSVMDEVVLDPFCGVGSTLVAAKLEGRRAVGIEISEAFCAIAADRLRTVEKSNERESCI